MPNLLIEDLLKDLGKDPAQLSNLEKRKYCILVDWALALSQKAESPFFEKIDLPQDEVDNLRKGIVTALTTDSDTFVALDKQKPDAEEMEIMFEALADHLQLSISGCDAGFIAFYDEDLAKKGLVHTNQLRYSSFSKDRSVEQESSHIDSLYQKLKEKNLFTAKRKEYFIYDEDKKWLDIANFDTLSHANKLAEKHAADLILFYAQIMSSLKSIQKAQNLKVSEETMLSLCDKIKPLVKHLNAASPTDLQAAKQISIRMQEVMPRDSNDKLKPKMGEALSELLFKFPAAIMFRDPKINNPQFPQFKFQTMSDFPAMVEQKKPVDRVIFIGTEDLANDESMRSLEILLLKHANENIVFTCKPEDIKRINQHNKELGAQFTLNVVGHGSLKGEKELNANLGPYKGVAATTGQKLAMLVNDCSQVNHLRVTGCFTGLLKDNADLKKYPLVPKEKYATSEISRTFTMVIDSDLTDGNSPFVDTSVAVHCWNAINRKGREISMTVSPGIIEPDESIGRMVWKAAASRSNPEHRGIKEVRITTSEDPKNKPKSTLK